MSDRAQRLWRAANRPVQQAEVVRCLTKQHERCLGLLRDNRDKLNRTGDRLLKVGAYALLIDALDVEREGTTLLGDVYG